MEEEKKMTFVQLLPDGHIAIPQDVIEQLHLQSGDILKLTQSLHENKLTEEKKTAIYQNLAQSISYYPTPQDAMQATRNWEKDW